MAVDIGLNIAFILLCIHPIYSICSNFAFVGITYICTYYIIGEWKVLSLKHANNKKFQHSWTFGMPGFQGNRDTTCGLKVITTVIWYKKIGTLTILPTVSEYKYSLLLQFEMPIKEFMINFAFHCILSPNSSIFQRMLKVGSVHLALSTGMSSGKKNPPSFHVYGQPLLNPEQTNCI